MTTKEEKGTLDSIRISPYGQLLATKCQSVKNVSVFKNEIPRGDTWFFINNYFGPLSTIVIISEGRLHACLLEG